MKFGLRELQIMTWNIYAFREKQHREGRAFAVGINEKYSVTCIVKACDILKVKIALVKAVYCVTVTSS
jgi:hypothetical protein